MFVVQGRGRYATEGRRDSRGEGHRRLVGLVPQCSGTPLEKELARAIAGWERDKRTKDEIAALKREIEAEELWREAQALASEDETRKAEAKVRLLLRKYDGSYLTTPGISKEWSWRPHQQRVVARIIQAGNTYINWV